MQIKTIKCDICGKDMTKEVDMQSNDIHAVLIAGYGVQIYESTWRHERMLDICNRCRGKLASHIEQMIKEEQEASFAKRKETKDG